jgi:hypothetical protein
MLEKQMNDYTLDAYGERAPRLNPAFWEQVAAEDERQATAASECECECESTRPPHHSNASIPHAGEAVPVMLTKNNESSSSSSNYEIPPFRPEASVNVEHVIMNEDEDENAQLPPPPPPRSGTKANPPRAPRYNRETTSNSLFRPLLSTTSLCAAAKRFLQATVRATSYKVTRKNITHQVSRKIQDVVKEASLGAKQKVVSSFHKEKDNYQQVLVQKTKHTGRMLRRQMKRASVYTVKSLKFK